MNKSLVVDQAQERLFFLNFPNTEQNQNYVGPYSMAPFYNTQVPSSDEITSLLGTLPYVRYERCLFT